LLSKEGRKAEYWTKPLLGKPYVPGSAYIIGSYYHFIVGCSLAGLVNIPPTLGMKVLPGAESLVTYYLEVPENKKILDDHFKESDEYAAQTLSPETRALMGDTRTMIMQNSPGRGDEGLLSILWAVRRGSKLPIDESIRAYADFVLLGSSVDLSEVARLWGIQASTSPIPLLAMPLDQARASTLADVHELTS
jgi:hypothetical protein